VDSFFFVFIPTSGEPQKPDTASCPGSWQIPEGANGNGKNGFHAHIKMLILILIYSYLCKRTATAAAATAAATKSIQHFGLHTFWCSCRSASGCAY